MMGSGSKGNKACSVCGSSMPHMPNGPNSCEWDMKYTVAVEGTKESLLIEANDLLRSAYAIAERAGNSTNWEAFKLRLLSALISESDYMHKTVHIPAATCTAKTFRIDLEIAGPKECIVTRPRYWSQEESHAWHRAIPDVLKAFDDLAAARKSN